MLRCSLGKLILKCKVSRMGEPKLVLESVLSPPNQADLNREIINLHMQGCLTRSSIDHPSGDLTFLGKICANMPCDIKISRLCLMGYALGCMDQCLIIGAALSIDKNIFASRREESDRIDDYNDEINRNKNFNFEFESHIKRCEWDKGFNSDLLA